ncbi:TIGR00282 family metallophosphoesterase [bacterium]|nr:MAG: TIGR00282 family metallophosphoesterase [bacterium]
MKILFISDIFGKPGRLAVHEALPALKEKYTPDIVIANAENIAGGFGITRNLCTKLFRYGVDIITTGNHVWDRDEAPGYLPDESRVLRPINFPADTTPGKGSIVFETESGGKVGVINTQGRVFMRAIDDPFRTTLAEVERIRKETPIIIVDMHAEATSEKKAMGYYLDGKVSAVVGTHTHIQTADEQILPKGTAFITDCGMTGPHDSVIGVLPRLAIQFLLSCRNVRFSPAKDGVRLQGVILDIGDDTGLARRIERVDIALED